MTEKVVGMVLVRPAPIQGMQPFMSDLAQGIEAAFAGHDTSLLIQLVSDPAEEQRLWRRWADERSVDAIIMTDHHEGDPRVGLAAELPIPVVLLGGDSPSLPLSHVFVDNAEGARAAARTFADLGHRHLARVGGPRNLLHTQARDEAFHRVADELGLTVVLGYGDFSERSGGDAVRALLERPVPPTAILFDNDLMAVGGIAVAAELGRRVPADLAVIAWDDTANARLSTPPLSVVAIDVFELGSTLGAATLDAIAGAEPRVYTVPAPTVRLAEST